MQHFSADTEDLKDRTRTLMHELQRESAYLPTIVIHELYKEQFETVGKDAAETRLNIITQGTFEIVNLDIGIAKEAGRLRCGNPTLPTADAIIAATAITTRSLRVVTDDPHFKAIREIKTDWV